MAWLTGYNYRTKIPVNSTVSGAQTNYQMKLSIYKSTGTNIAEAIYLNNNSLSWPNDIRFTDANGNSIDFWREVSDANSGTWWVEIPSIPSTGSVDVYIHYGKVSDADASNGRNTFIAFDDFATGSSEQWTMAGVTADRTTNHRLNINGTTGSTSAHLDKGSDIGDYELLYTYMRTSGAAAGFGSGTGDTISNNIDSPIQNAAVGFDHPGTNAVQYRFLRLYQAGIDYGGTHIIAGADNTLYYGKLTRLNNVYTYTVYSDAARTSQVWHIPITRAGLTNQRYVYAIATVRDALNTAIGWLKDIRIRKYVSTEPTWATPLTQEVNATWNYRKEITISNSGSALTDYQVSVTVDAATLVSTGKMLPTCQDIRFVDSDNSTILPYWIESGINTSSTIIWIKIPSVPNGSKTIYMYYGNSSATYDNSLGGINTFVLYAGLHNTSYVSPTLPIIGAGYIYTNLINLSQQQAQGDNVGFGFGDSSSRFPSNSILVELYGGWTSKWYLWRSLVGGTATNDLYMGSPSYSWPSTHKYEIVYASSSSAKLYQDGTQIGVTMTSGLLTGPMGIFMNIGDSTGYQTSYYQFVRKYALPEPTFDVSGTEQTPPNITATLMTISRNETPCRVGFCTITVDITWTNNGGSEGSFVPNITIDGSSITPIYILQPLANGASVTKTFVITDLSAGSHPICPDPN